jgi:hypothetical protein
MFIEWLLEDNKEELHRYVNFSSFDIRQQLVSQQFRAPEVLSHNPTIIMLAIYFGALQMFRYLLDVLGDLTQVDSIGQTVCHFAAAGGNLGVFWDLYNLVVPDRWDVPDRRGRRPLELAAFFGHPVIVQKLEQWGFASDSPDRRGIRRETLMATARGAPRSAEVMGMLGLAPANDCQVIQLARLLGGSGDADGVIYGLVNWARKCPGFAPTAAEAAGMAGFGEVVRILIPWGGAEAGAIGAARKGNWDIVTYIVSKRRRRIDRAGIMCQCASWAALQGEAIYNALQFPRWVVVKWTYASLLEALRLKERGVQALARHPPPPADVKDIPREFVGVLEAVVRLEAVAFAGKRSEVAAIARDRALAISLLAGRLPQKGQCRGNQWKKLIKWGFTVPEMLGVQCRVTEISDALELLAPPKPVEMFSILDPRDWPEFARRFDARTCRFSTSYLTTLLIAAVQGLKGDKRQQAFIAAEAAVRSIWPGSPLRYCPSEGCGCGYPHLPEPPQTQGFQLVAFHDPLPDPPPPGGVRNIGREEAALGPLWPRPWGAPIWSQWQDLSDSSD